MLYIFVINITVRPNAHLIVTHCKTWTLHQCSTCVLSVFYSGPTVAIAVGVIVGCIVLITVVVIVIVVLRQRGLLKKKGINFSCTRLYWILFC